MSDFVVNGAFAEVGDFEYAVVDGFAEVVFLAEVGNYLVGDEPLHLERDAGEADDSAFLGFDHECGCGAVGVSDHLGTSWYLGLALVVFGEDEAAVLESFVQFGQGIRVSHDVNTKHLGYCLTREIVLGRSDAATGNYDISAIKRDAEDFGHAVLVVADARLIEDVCAVFSETLGNPSGVGVDDLTQ